MSQRGVGAHGGAVEENADVGAEFIIFTPVPEPALDTSTRVYGNVVRVKAG